MASVKFAVVDVNDFLTKKQSTEPNLATEWATLEELYNKKLWHQITLKLQDFVKRPELKKNDNLIQLYANFLSTFENKINPLSLIEICAHIVEQYGNKKEAIAFLEKMEPKVKINDEALTLCKVLQGQIYLEQLNDLEATEKIISQLEGTLEDADGVTPVHGRFYKLASEYYRVRGPMARYYRSALRYLGCTNAGNDLPPEERRVCALRLALAAVIAPTVYDLGELLAHPILESLENTPDAWAIQLVSAVSAGDIAAFEAVRARAPHPELQRADTQLNVKIAILCLMQCQLILESLENTPDAWAIQLVSAVSAGDIAAFEAVRSRAPHPELQRADTQLNVKIAILCLMQMAFNRTSAQRKLTFSEIAREARVPHDEVELLVMKALAEKLVRGHIDQVSETVSITWVRPRALPRAGAAALARRLDTWCAAVASAASLLQRQAPDLLTL